MATSEWITSTEPCIHCGSEKIIGRQYPAEGAHSAADDLPADEEAQYHAADCEWLEELRKWQAA